MLLFYYGLCPFHVPDVRMHIATHPSMPWAMDYGEVLRVQLSPWYWSPLTFLFCVLCRTVDTQFGHSNRSCPWPGLLPMNECIYPPMPTHALVKALVHHLILTAVIHMAVYSAMVCEFGAY